MPDLNKKIKDLRVAKKMTQTDLANILGVTKSVVSAYETGARQPSYEVLIAIATYFDVSMDFLFDTGDYKIFKGRDYIDITGIDKETRNSILQMVNKLKNPPKNKSS